MGISIEEFKHLNPKKLEWCYKGYKLKKEEEDRNSWQRWGDYGISALIFAIEHCLNGRKAQSKYIDKPIMERADIADNEKEIQKQRKAFLTGLMAMQANFELSHPKKEKQT